MGVYAGIDIGTLTVRLLIARIESDGTLQQIASERRIVRLGEGLQASRRLQPVAMTRAVDTLRSWMPVIEQAGAQHITAVATSAVRDAINREEFLDEVKRATGLEVEMISGKEEARRSLLGVQAGLPSGIERFLALDIGGGSTEFIKAAPGHRAVMISLDEGVVRLTESCLKGDPVRSDEVASAKARMRLHLEGIARDLGSMEGYQLVGTAGTITTLAAMDQRLETYAPLRIHNYRLSLEALHRIMEELVPRTHAERRTLPGLEAGREDLILAGTLILLEVMERFGFQECLVSDYGLREGVLIDLWQRTGVVHTKSSSL